MVTIERKVSLRGKRNDKSRLRRSIIVEVEVDVDVDGELVVARLDMTVARDAVLGEAPFGLAQRLLVEWNYPQTSSHVIVFT